MTGAVAVPTVVHVRLLDEGTDVWRPTTAREIGPATYELLPTPDYDPASETWEFEPGTTVRCEWRDLSGGRTLVALRWVAGPPPRSDAHLKVIDEKSAAASRRSEAMGAWILAIVLLAVAALFGVQVFDAVRDTASGLTLCAIGVAALLGGAALQRLCLLRLLGVFLMAIGAGLVVGGGVALVVRAQ